MRKALLFTVAALVAFPAYAATVVPGQTGAVIDPIDPLTRGTQLIFASTSGQALTFAAEFRSAVYRNTSGTLDFYYQVLRTGAGSNGRDNMITSFTVAQFGTFTTDALRDGSAQGGFAAANNPGGFTSTANRGFSGEVVGVDFGQNGLVGTENSTTYIFRTNATMFTSGTFGVIDGSALQGNTFAPTAVPEPATWAMMVGGFGLLGAAARRSRRTTTVLA